MRKGYVLSTLLFAVVASLPAGAQTAPNDSPESQEVPRFKVLSARFITEATGMFGSSWSIKNSARTGLLVAVEASFTNESLEVKPTSFFIEYSLGGGSRFDEECIGLDSSAEPKPGDWIFVEPGVKPFLSLRRTAQGNASFALLFEVSKKIDEFSLVYRHPAAVAKAVVTK